MRVGKASGEEWLRLGEAAAVLGVSLNTLRRWSDSGKLTCYRSPGGHRRYRRSHVESLLAIEGFAGSGAGAAVAALPRATSLDAELAQVRAPLAALARATAEGIRASSCAFAVFTSAKTVRAVAQYPAAPGDSHETTATLDRVPVAGEVLRTGRRLVIADLAHTNLLTRDESQIYTKRGDKAILALPILTGGRVTAMMELAERRSKRTFSGANVAFAEFMAQQAAVLLSGNPEQPDDAGSYGVDLAVDALGPVAQLPARATGPPEPPTTLQAMTDQLRHEVNAVACDVLVYQSTLQQFTIVATTESAAPLPLEGLHCTLRDLPFLEPILRGRSVTLTDMTGEGFSGAHHVRFQHNGARSAFCTPLRARDEIVGMLEVFSADPRRVFTGDELALVEAVATVAALGLDALDLERVLTGRLARLDGPGADVDVASPGVAAESLAEAALQALCAHQDCAVCSLYHIAGDSAALVLRAGGESLPSAEPWLLDDYPAAHEAIARLAPVVVAPGEWPAPGAPVLSLGEHGLTGAVLAPVTLNGVVVGLLEAGSKSTAGLQGAAALAGVTAGVLAVALGADQTVAALRRSNRDLELVVEAGLEDTARLSSEEVLHAVAERLATLTRTPVTDIFSVEGDTLRSLVSFDGGRFDAGWEGVVIPLLRYPCIRSAVDTGEITIAASLDDPILTEDGRYSLEKWGYQAQLSMPLVSGGRVIGLVQLSDYVPRDFRPDLRLVRGLGQVAAHALQNAMHFEQVERRSRALTELVGLGDMSSRTRDLNTLFRQIAERLQTVVDAANCDIFRVCDEGLRCEASYDRSGHDEQLVGSLLDRSRYPTLVAAMNSHQILVVTRPDDPQLSQDERDTYRELGFASEVCIPLIVNNELYGVIDMYDTRERDYADFLAFFESAGRIVARACETALLFDKLERRTRVLRELFELSAITAQAHDLQAVLLTVAERLRITVAAADCDIFTLQGGRLTCLVSVEERGIDTDFVGNVLDLDRFPATAKAAREAEAMVIASRDDPRLTDEERADMREYGFQSELCIPLVAGDRVIGLIDIFDTRPRDYSEYLDFTKSVGSMAAGAIENALLLEQLESTNHMLKLTVDSGLEFGASLALEDVLQSVARRLCAAAKAPVCDIYTVTSDRFRCVACIDGGEADTAYIGTEYALADFPLISSALSSGQPVMVTDIAADPRLSDGERHEDLRWGHRSTLELPLVSRGEVIGLASVFDDHPREFEQLDLMHSLAQVAANALANATLFERLERSADGA